MKPIGLSLYYLGHLNSLFYAKEMICFSIDILNVFTDVMSWMSFFFSIYMHSLLFKFFLYIGA